MYIVYRNEDGTTEDIEVKRIQFVDRFIADEVGKLYPIKNVLYVKNSWYF